MLGHDAVHFSTHIKTTEPSCAFLCALPFSLRAMYRRCAKLDSPIINAFSVNDFISTFILLLFLCVFFNFSFAHHGAFAWVRIVLFVSICGRFTFKFVLSYEVCNKNFEKREFLTIRRSFVDLLACIFAHVFMCIIFGTRIRRTWSTFGVRKFIKQIVPNRQFSIR